MGYSLSFNFCYEENYELEKDRLEHDFDDKLLAMSNVTNHNLIKREVYKYKYFATKKLGNEELTYPLILVTGSHGKGSTVLKIAAAIAHTGKVKY